MAAKLMSNTPTIASDYQESVESYRQLILSTGEDLQRPGLEETPMRAAKGHGSCLTAWAGAFFSRRFEQPLSDHGFFETSSHCVQ